MAAGKSANGRSAATDSSMRIHDPRLLALARTLVVGCGQERPAQAAGGAVASGDAAATASHPVATCLEGDSVVFSDVVVDTAETGDASGVQITLRRLAS